MMEKRKKGLVSSSSTELARNDNANYKKWKTDRIKLRRSKSAWKVLLNRIESN